MKYDLGWGNSICVREAFLSSYLGNPIQFNKDDLLKFDYPEHSGDLEAIEITKKVVKRQIGKEYKHVFMTNGATGGVVIALRAFAQQGYQYCHTRNAPFYIRYPRMIQASGLMHVQEGYVQWKNDSVMLLDLPSNPLGLMTESEPKESYVPLIVDGVYLNQVYMPPLLVQTPEHDVFVGSYSKLLGINGIRLGWLATNDDSLAAQLKELVASEYCGLSTASTVILKQALFGLNWDNFEKTARYKLDCNREEFAQLERFLGGKPVTELGMFHYAPMDSKAQEIFSKAGITWTPGSAMGTDNSFARFNLGQNNDLLADAVATVLKVDKIK